MYDFGILTNIKNSYFTGENLDLDDKNSTFSSSLVLTNKEVSLKQKRFIVDKIFKFLDDVV